MSVRTFAYAALLAVTPLALNAAPWTLDKSHAHINFSISHLGFSDTQGVFREFDAEISFDPENMEASTVSVTIDASSVDTFWEARDAHIRRSDILDVENHPTITFVSTSVEQTGENTAVVTGDMTMLGETREVSFDAVMNNMGPNPFRPDVTVAGFTLTGEIDRTEFGLGFGAPAIGTVVPVEINVELSPAS